VVYGSYVGAGQAAAERIWAIGDIEGDRAAQNRHDTALAAKRTLSAPSFPPLPNYLYLQIIPEWFRELNAAIGLLVRLD